MTLTVIAIAVLLFLLAAVSVIYIGFRKLNGQLVDWAEYSADRMNAALVECDKLKDAIKYVAEENAVCFKQLNALQERFDKLAEDKAALDAEIADEAMRALQAERRYTEGVANILGYSYDLAQAAGKGDKA